MFHPVRTAWTRWGALGFTTPPRSVYFEQWWHLYGWFYETLVRDRGTTRNGVNNITTNTKLCKIHIGQSIDSASHRKLCSIYSLRKFQGCWICSKRVKKVWSAVTSLNYRPVTITKICFFVRNLLRIQIIVQIPIVHVFKLSPIFFDNVITGDKLWLASRVQRQSYRVPNSTPCVPKKSWPNFV